MIGEIRQLNPKPGLAFGSTLVQPIVPDVFVRPAPDGGFIVELNSDTLPKVLVNQSYHAEVAKTAKNDKDKTYLADCLQTATWLMRALDQRAKTILKVSTEIVRQQDAFFAHGVQHLRPLNLKTVADAIAMHESTVSRVTANKYMATNRGIFELKYFFTSAIASADGGEAHSAEAVRHRIRQLIDAEDPSRSCPTTRSWKSCARPESTSPGERSQNIARRCESRPRCNGGGRSRRRWARPPDAARLSRRENALAHTAASDASAFRHDGRTATRERRSIMPFRVSGKNIDVGEALRARINRAHRGRARRNISTAAIPATSPSARRDSASAPNA